MKILGIDIGGTNIDCVIYDGGFDYIGTFPTQTGLQNLNSILDELVEENGIDAIGAGIALWIKEGKPLHAPNLPLIPELSSSVPLFFENDANCFAIFSYHVFKFPNIFAVTVGTGVGGGLIISGELYTGNGLAGEIGHVVVGGDEKCHCGGKGHLESKFGGWALKKKYGKDVKELMEDEDFIYNTEEFRIFCSQIANAVTVLDPHAVVFGGRIGMHLDEIQLRECIYSELMPPFSPEIEILDDELAVSKGACIMAEKRLREKEL